MRPPRRPPSARATPESFAPLVKRVLPAVVNIAVTETVSGKELLSEVPPELRDTPLGREFRRRFGDKRTETTSAGSGFIIDPAGVIVTNRHVIEHADQIAVALSDGTELPARVIGSDEVTDVAVIQVSAPHPLPAVGWGDSRAVEAGDWILAAGNPFGLGGSVTAGIVSAIGRDLGAGPFDNFLQLDAPINPGNSGGPAFNMDGQVVGMTTAIVSPSGGSVGIGFAVPSEIIRPIVAELRAKGRIDRGWLGVALRDTEATAGRRRDRRGATQHPGAAGRPAPRRRGARDQRRGDRQQPRADPRRRRRAARRKRAAAGPPPGARVRHPGDGGPPARQPDRVETNRPGQNANGIEQGGPAEIVMRILVVEDDKDVAGFVVRGLKEAGHVVEQADNGRDGLFMAASEAFDAIILDRMLPGGIDGLHILETLRAQKNAVPVLILSALADVDERVRGLKAGGDDYLSKPFAFAELLARVEALARRGKGEGPVTKLKVEDLELDLLSRQVKRAGQKIDLQPREFRLLEYLMRHAGQVVTRTMLLEGVWDYHFDPQTNVIDVHVSRLRQKVDKPFPTALIQTVRNAGYMLRAEDA